MSGLVPGSKVTVTEAVPVESEVEETKRRRAQLGVLPEPLAPAIEAVAGDVSLGEGAGLGGDDGELAAGAGGVAQAGGEQGGLDAAAARGRQGGGAAEEGDAVVDAHGGGADDGAAEGAAEAGGVAAKAGGGDEVSHDGVEGVAAEGVDGDGAAVGAGEAVDDGAQPGGVVLGEVDAGEFAVGVAGGERADEHVFEASEAVAAGAQLFGDAGVGEAGQLDAHGLAAGVPGGFDGLEDLEVERAGEAEADELVDR
jgi:hypothetical protein